MDHLGFDERVVGTIHQFINRKRLKRLSLVHGITKNWFSASLKIIEGKYPFTLELKNGGTLVVRSWIDILHLAYPNIIEEIVEDTNSAIVNFEGKKLVISEYNRGELDTTFIREDYKQLNVSNKTVVDVGAGIGETCIYFALRGSRKVIGIEPYLLLYNIAMHNIFSNGLQDIVELVNAGCGEDGSAFLDATIGSPALSLRNIPGGTKVPVYSLRSVVEKFSVPEGSVLKVDCEGCEYDFILNADDKILARFDQIFIEYHYGGDFLVRKLKRAGFRVNKSWPIRGYNAFLKKAFYTGYIQANR
jgi:FkbM family methyltransferase